MGKVILFSPVGGTDPISMSNYRDGSLIHICRFFRPDKVVLYMSKEILDNHKKDNRYLYCLEKLAELQHRKMTYEMIERPDLVEVQDFDYFYEEFRRIIHRLSKELDDTDRLLLNISSGTPSMKSGLLVLQTMGEYRAELVQVSTPERKMNEHLHKGYEVQLLWELNEDNEPDVKNRCRIIQCPSLTALKKIENIRRHISVYNYQAGIDVARTLPVSETESYLQLLQMAYYRQLLDFKSVDRILRDLDFDCLPVRSGNGRKCFEYALNLDIKVKRGEYADFIRGITPLIVDLFEMVLRNQKHIDLSEYCEDGAFGRMWSIKRLRGTEMLDCLNRGFQGDFRCGNIYSIHLKVLIDYYLKKEVRLVKITDDLRTVEKTIRNLTAHEIISVTDEIIFQKTGLHSRQIMDRIKEVFTYTKIQIPAGAWDSYDELNKKLYERIR